MSTFLEICKWMGKVVLATIVMVFAIPVLYMIVPLALAIGIPILGAIGIRYYIYQFIKGKTRQS